MLTAVCTYRMPAPTAPDMSKVSGTATDAISLAIVAFAISVSLAKLMGKKNAYDVDANQVSHYTYDT